MLKGLFGSAKNDPFNQARDHFHKLRYFTSDDPAYITNLISIVRLCQLAIGKRPADGDAHILLANAYLLIAFTNPFGGIYSFSLARAAATIYQWANVPMRSKERAIGEKILRGVQEELLRDRPDWMGPSLPNDLSMLHENFYRSALDPLTLDEMSRLINSED